MRKVNLLVAIAAVLSIPAALVKLHLQGKLSNLVTVELVERIEHNEPAEVGLSKMSDLDTSVFLFEVFSKRTNKRVFYIDVQSLDKDMISKGWKRTMPINESDVCEKIKDEISCLMDYMQGEKAISFGKFWPSSEYYFVHTIFYGK